MLLGSILLAVAWAALQGEITLVNLLVGYAVGYGILALLARGGVMPYVLCVGSGRLLRVGTAGRELPRRRRCAPGPPD
jgi:multisubunit Na+/H+ antiporter MnhE subunit